MNVESNFIDLKYEVFSLLLFLFFKAFISHKKSSTFVYFFFLSFALSEKQQSFCCITFFCYHTKQKKENFFLPYLIRMVSQKYYNNKSIITGFFVQFHISLTVKLKSLFLMFSFIHPNFLYTNKVELFYAVVWWLVLWSHFSYFHLLFGSLNDDWKEKKEVKHYLSWCWIFSFLLPYQMLILGFSGIIWNMAIYCLSICLFVYELKSVEIEMFTIFFFFVLSTYLLHCWKTNNVLTLMSIENQISVTSKRWYTFSNI